MHDEPTPSGEPRADDPAQARNRLRAATEAYESSQAELRESNQDLRSTNEELRSTLEAMETSQEQLQQNLLSATGIATIFLDLELRIQRFTPRVETLFSVRDSDRGRPLADLQHPLASGEILDDAEQVLRTLDPTEREVRDEEGEWYLARVSPYRASEDRVEGVVLTFVSITRLKETQDRLAAAEKQQRELALSVTAERGRLAAILNSLPVGVWVADETGRLVMKNEMADRIWAGDVPLSGGVEEYGSYRAWNSETGEPLEPEDYPVARTLRTGEAVDSTELRIERFDGTEGTVLVSSAPVVDRDGTILGAVGVNHDITERKRMEAELRQAKAQAEHAAQAKSQFLSTLSHELRTPLNAVIGLAEIVRQEIVGPVNDAQRGHLRRIERSAWHQLSMIEEILSFTSTEAGQARVRASEVNAGEIVAEVTELLEPAAAAKEISIERRGAGRPLIVTTDAGKLRQILTNLVGNAVKFTRKGGVEVELEADEEHFQVRVRDTGPGIPEDSVEEVFDPFVQLDGSPTRQAGGTGLGLAVSRRLARLMGGDILVESTPGEGSVFTVRLPREATDEEEETG